jgi:hypothetical protein
LGEATAQLFDHAQHAIVLLDPLRGREREHSWINVVSTSKARDRLAGKKTPKPRANKAIEQARKAAPQR